MQQIPPASPEPPSARPTHPFRRAMLRGLAIVLPPLLTIVVFLWAWTLIHTYMLRPVETATSWILIHWEWDVRREQPDVDEIDDFHQIPTGHWIPLHVYAAVRSSPGVAPPHTALGYYHRYVRLRYLRPWIVIPLFMVVFVGLLYVAGRSLAAGVGRWAWSSFESVVRRLPLVSNVYSSVKQVTDFVFSERNIEFSRVVAVEYPRKGIWSIGFVTGESMLDLWSTANEPVVSLLMPTSPMPMTGFTITVRKSETIDMDLTVDQAIQFMISCGVVIPPQQLRRDQVDVGADVFARIPRVREPQVGGDNRGPAGEAPANSRTRG